VLCQIRRFEESEVAAGLVGGNSVPFAPVVDMPLDVDGDRIVVEWNTAMAGPDPIRSYEVRAGQRVLASLPFRPQLSEAPLTTWVDAAEAADGQITVIASTAMPRARG